MALCFLAVNKERENWAQMFNDEVMVLYLAMAIFYLAKSKPLTGVFWFSMAYGMKAGALLLIPSMLGSIQYNHGISKLIQCTIFLVGFQIVIALPFLLTAPLDYLIRSKLTGAGRNGIQGSAAFWDYLAAHQSLSIFWTFLPEELYFDKSKLANTVKLVIPAVNVWFFFVRKNCLPKCLHNLGINSVSKMVGWDNAPKSAIM